MTLQVGLLPLNRLYPVLFALLLAPIVAYSQITLTGASQFSTESTGAITQTGWMTAPVSGNCCYGLWMSLNPDGTAPLNGPSMAQSPIAIPLEAGNSYKYYTFGYPYQGFSFNGLNLFFDGTDSTPPGISVFQATNSYTFRPNTASTLNLQNVHVPGSGSSSYSANGVVAVLTGYDFHTPFTLNVCQGYSFTPSDLGVPDYYGSFTLRVFQAASLSLNTTSGTPGTQLTFTGSGFAPAELIEIYVGNFGAAPALSTTSNADGGFNVSTLEPQDAYGTIEIFAVGSKSQKLGTALLSVTPGVVATPESVEPGGTATAQGFGFGSGELVSVYLDEPRVLLGTATANSLGSFTGNTGITVTIPSNATIGRNALLGIGQTTQAMGLGRLTVK